MIISLVLGFVVGNRLTDVLLTAFICTLLAGGLGFGVIRFIELRVPELLSLFQSDGVVSSSEDLSGASDFTGDGNEAGDLSGGYGSETSSGGGYSGEGEPATSIPSVDDEARVYGDHILVNRVKIKNEPKLIAQAIKTMLAKDEE